MVVYILLYFAIKADPKIHKQVRQKDAYSANAVVQLQLCNTPCPFSRTTSPSPIVCLLPQICPHQAYSKLLKTADRRNCSYRCCSIVARLDYCNAVLYGAPATTLNKLQRVQDNLARAVCRRGGRADARLLLKSLARG